MERSPQVTNLSLQAAELTTLLILLFFVFTLFFTLTALLYIVIKHATWFQKANLVNDIIRHNKEPTTIVFLKLEYSLWTFSITPIFPPSPKKEKGDGDSPIKNEKQGEGVKKDEGT
jgi:uncharacterized membrane protein YcgQ (UPF0703/DUF1980 family)